MRKPLQGVLNIIKFNWHFYVIALLAVVVLAIASFWLFPIGQMLAWLVISGIIGTTIISLAVSAYVYDFSGFYTLNWCSIPIGKNAKVLNINAGFDESSQLLVEKFQLEDIQVFDFYNPEKHTEVSIKRAREAYPPYPNTQSVETTNLPLEAESLDIIFLIFAAHEIRDEHERNQFFEELRQALKPDGKIILVEHLRDLPNFLAYNIGFMHFLPLKSWHHAFSNAGLYIANQAKITPFVNVFTLQKHGNPS